MMASIFFTERLPGTSIFRTALLFPRCACCAACSITCPGHSRGAPRCPARVRRKRERLGMPFHCREHDESKAGFLKSRVHAKLLKPLILKCYQTINGCYAAIISKGQTKRSLQN